MRIYNRMDIQMDVKGDDGEVYFLPPRSITELPTTVSELGEGLVEVVSETTSSESTAKKD